MPVEHSVEALEHAGAHHIGLAAAAFLGRAAEELDRAPVAFGEPFGGRHRACHRTGAEKVVPAAVAVGSRDEGLAVRDGVLRHSGKRVILGHNADYRRTGPVTCHESRRDAAGSPLHRESAALQVRGPLLRAADFLVAGLRIVPYALLQRVVEMETALYVPQAGGGRILHPLLTYCEGTGRSGAYHQQGRTKYCKSLFHNHFEGFFSQPLATARPRIATPAIRQTVTKSQPSPWQKARGDRLTRAISTGAIYKYAKA